MHRQAELIRGLGHRRAGGQAVALADADMGDLIPALAIKQGIHAPPT